jgi:hypothetical protein
MVMNLVKLSTEEKVEFVYMFLRIFNTQTLVCVFYNLYIIIYV